MTLDPTRASSGPPGDPPASAHAAAFEELARQFCQATGLPLSLIGCEGAASQEHSAKFENPFCQFLKGEDDTCRICQETRSGLIASAQGGADAAHAETSIHCPAGLTETLLPLRVRGRIIGFLQTGQLFLHQPTAERFDRLCRWMTRRGLKFDRAKLEKLYFQSRVISPKQYDAILNLLRLASHQLVQKVEAAEAAGPSPRSLAVQRACRHIQENYQEALTLGSVARVAGLSRHHFCKLFHREMGETFTSYVTRLRIERATTYLREPFARVSEVAMMVGFQSISQFNRSFKRVTGRSPSELRSGAPRSGLHKLAELATEEGAAAPA